MQSDLKCLIVAGKKLDKFISGITTNRLSSSPTLSAFCNQSGKVIALAVVYLHEDVCYVLVQHELAARLEKHLAFYGRFSRVQIEVLEGYCVLDAQLQKTGQHQVEDFSEWYDYLYQKGLVFLDEANSEKFTPQMLAYDKHELIDWHKGCYLGQEVIARVSHRGRNKRHLYQIVSPYPNEAHVVLQVGDQALAVISDSDIVSIQDRGVQLTLVEA